MMLCAIVDNTIPLGILVNNIMKLAKEYCTDNTTQSRYSSLSEAAFLHRGRVGLGLGDIVQCGFRDAVGQLAMAGGPRRSRSTTRTMPYTTDLIRRYMLMLHLSPCVPGLAMLTFPCVGKKRASPCRDAIAQVLAQRHTKQVSFGQGSMMSVRIELWGSRNRHCRSWPVYGIVIFLP